MPDENFDVEYLQQIENQLREADKDRRMLAKSQLGLAEINSEDNLVKWQLNLEEEKERIYHLLKGHRRSVNDKGEEIWVEPLTQDSVVLNDYGVDYIMGLLESFVNRNIILSNFDEDRINEICMDLCTQLTNDIYNDYEKMGLDTDEKRKKAAIIVFKVWVNVESALRRAVGGRENLNLRKIITVSQNESPQRQMDFPMVQQKKRKLWGFLGQ